MNIVTADSEEHKKRLEKTLNFGIEPEQRNSSKSFCCPWMTCSH